MCVFIHTYRHTHTQAHTHTHTHTHTPGSATYGDLLEDSFVINYQGASAGVFKVFFLMKNFLASFFVGGTFVFKYQGANAGDFKLFLSTKFFLANFFVEGQLCHHMDDNVGAHNAFFFWHIHIYTMYIHRCVLMF